jgi:sialate O-acetylesterase
LESGVVASGVFGLLKAGCSPVPDRTLPSPGGGRQQRRKDIMTKQLFLVINIGLLAACGVEGLDGSESLAPPDGTEKSAKALGALSVAAIFRSSMVLQRDVAVPVFGTADPGAPVTVGFQGQDVTVQADATGQWLASLAAMPASTEPSSMTISSAGASVTFDDVQVGEVWLCSGQSNMGKPLSYADGSAPYIADAGNHNLRFFRMWNGTVPSETAWQISDPTTAADFSAVCYFMGLDLAEDLDAPVGLIQASYDGSAIAEWEHTSGGTGEYYDAMVVPLQPYAIKGVLWYQGESNGGDVSYEPKLTSMIAEWRGDWELPALPFGIVQLPATKWNAARIAQFNVSQTVADTYLVVTSDLPGSKQLHPTAKYEVGIRSSIGARGLVYGESIEYSGPVPAPTSYVSGKTVVVEFDHLGNGLATEDGAAPSTFQLAAANGRYVTATATIVGDRIVVEASRVSTPKYLRYGWSGAGNLRNTVDISTEGGAQTVSMLPTSLFELEFP